MDVKRTPIETPGSKSVQPGAPTEIAERARRAEREMQKHRCSVSWSEEPAKSQG